MAFSPGTTLSPSAESYPCLPCEAVLSFNLKIKDTFYSKSLFVLQDPFPSNNRPASYKLHPVEI